MKHSYVLINKENLKNNILNLTNKYGDYEYYFGVVKANSYGHGYEIIDTLIESGINYLAVADIAEAMEIRENYKNIPILILEPVSILDLEACSKYNFTITISDYAYYLKVCLSGLKLKFHLKIDSGMHRLGINNIKEIETIYNTKNNLYLEGVYSHFATANDKYSEYQIKEFKRLIKPIKKVDIVHMSNSINTISGKLAFCNGCRLGLSMYGFTPDNKETFNLITDILQIKDVKKDDLISYGANTKLNHDGRIAILGIGYSDGVYRKSVGRCVSINGNLYKIIAMCMNMTIIEIDDKVSINDPVYFIGDKTNVFYVSDYLGIEPYEVISVINPKLKRVIR